MIEIDLVGREHSIVACTPEKVNVHLSKILECIPENQVEDYVKSMLHCVYSGTAFCVEDDSCFLYYLKDVNKPSFCTGISLYGKSKPLGIMAIFSYVFGKLDNKIVFMVLNPHSKTFMSESKSLLTSSSMSDYFHGTGNLVVRISDLKQKMTKILNSRKL